MHASDVAYQITASGISIFCDGKFVTVPNDHSQYTKIREAIAAKDYPEAMRLADITPIVHDWLAGSNGEFKLVAGQIEYQNRPFSHPVTNKVLAMIEAGNDPDALFNFLRKIRKNPSKQSQDECFLFMVANGFMIHADGDILGYKGVREDFKDIHSNSVMNTIGAVITMERGMVDDNRDNTCSFGFHIAAHDYASTWSGAIEHVMIVKLNPADVVSIPSDHSNQKMRCCRYEVIGEAPRKEALKPREVYTDDDIDEDTEVDNNARIDELVGELHEVQAELHRLRDEVEQIEELGGEPNDEKQSMLDDLEENETRLRDQLQELGWTDFIDLAHLDVIRF